MDFCPNFLKDYTTDLVIQSWQIQQIHHHPVK
jgi:hypothetical protein